MTCLLLLILRVVAIGVTAVAVVTGVVVCGQQAGDNTLLAVGNN